MRGQPASRSVQAVRGYSGILQVHRLEQLMQRDMRVHAVPSCRSRRQKTQDGRKWTVAKAGESEVEPCHVRLHCSDGAHQGRQIAILSESPTASDFKAGQFLGRCWEIISQHRQINTPLLPKLICDVETVFVEHMSTGRKRSDERNLHGSLARNTMSLESLPRRCK